MKYDTVGVTAARRAQCLFNLIVLIPVIVLALLVGFYLYCCLCYDVMT